MDYEPASLIRRVAAMIYDGLLWVAVLFLATAIAMGLVVVVYGSEIFSDGNPLTYNPLFRAYLVCVSFLFFGSFWVVSGQTLGMMAWRLRVQTFEGKKISWGQALKRFLSTIVAIIPFGLGYFWISIDPQRRSWPDLWSGTQVVYLPKTLSMAQPKSSTKLNEPKPSTRR